MRFLEKESAARSRMLKAVVATVSCAAIAFGSVSALAGAGETAASEEAQSTIYTMAMHDEGNEAQWDAIVQIGEQVTGTVTSYNATGIYNPHRNHRSNEECTTCHIPDAQPVLSCTMCHEINLPEGWASYYDVH